MRSLAGVVDASARTSSARTREALPSSANFARAGALQVAYTGPLAHVAETLCVLDGHLDNAAALAGELCLPARTAPEELLAACWRHWGSGCLGRLRGDFALLVWDAGRGEGMLARDQLGVRSLYLHDADGTLRFANELRYLLALLGSHPEPDEVGVAHWIAGRGRPDAGTLYAGVRRLEPGCAVVFGRDGAGERRYWAPRFEQPQPIGASELAHDVREAIDLAVRRRIACDGTTGVLMSGGLDSAAVAASARAVADRPLLACSGVFPDHAQVDESALIELLARSLGIEVVSAEVRPGGLLASALEAQAAWSLPLVGWGEFWALPLLRAARARGATQVLDGDGGDELFEVRSYLIADRMLAGRPREALGLIRRLPGADRGPSPGEVARVTANLALRGPLAPTVEKMLSRMRSDAGGEAWMRAHTRRLLRRTEDPAAWKRLDGPRWWARVAYALSAGIEQLGVFAALRRTAALAGVEVRHPLLDLDLVELVLRTPPEQSFDTRFDRPLLRACMAGRVPDEVRLRARKARFDSLVADCLRRDLPVIRAVLCDPNAELARWVDLDVVANALLAEPERARPSFRSMQLIWRLLTAELWLRSQDARSRCEPLSIENISEPSVAIDAGATAPMVE
jgi:asparagine synthase (glutamine-hydrolysing)